MKTDFNTSNQFQNDNRMMSHYSCPVITQMYQLDKDYETPCKCLYLLRIIEPFSKRPYHLLG